MHRHERLVLKSLSSGPSDILGLASETVLPEDSVLRALKTLEEKGAVQIKAERASSHMLTDEGKAFLANGFPEQKLVEKLARGALDFSPEEKRIGIPWALKNGWIEFTEKKEMVITKKGSEEHARYRMGELLRRLSENPNKPVEDDRPLLEALSKRGSIQIRERSSYSASLTDKGKRIASEVGEIAEEISVLDRELIMGRKWKSAELARYNTSAPVERIFPGKTHPLRNLTDKIRAVFSEMGFEEMEGEPVESAFWNFDALFQPQDHPARELADTFYLEGKDELPDEKLVGRVKEAHEKGWRYGWDPEIARRLVLRTHTTAVSARYVQKSGGKPSKYFCIGRVYRNEQTDFKHLAEFFQIEGIVVWEKATFCDLMGLLREFYRKLGFEKIRFRPSFFPYTEPSLEVEVFFEERNEWLELGGAGVFRPEVCLPLCGKYPILAWGLGLERPPMLKLGIEDIRTFYKNKLGWLRNSKGGI